MAGELVSLDFTPPSAVGEDSTTPLYPGYQALHESDSRGDWWVLRRVTLRSSVKLAARGVNEEVHTYPKHYATLEDALAAVEDIYAQDGPGDAGEDKALQEAVAAKGKAAAPAQPAAPAAPAAPAQPAAPAASAFGNFT